MAQLQIPGYYFDNGRYFKLLPGHAPPAPPPPTRPPGAPPPAKKQKRDHQSQHPTASTTLSDLVIRNRALADPSRRGASHKHALDSLSLTRLPLRQTLYPDSFPFDEDIERLSFDDRDPSVVRVGGSNGSIAVGALPGRKEEWMADYPNDENRWRTSWILPSRTTSLHACGDRLLATSIGPPAQALVGTTNDNISMASVTLAPRKTSLWTSALSSTLVALGCDKKVLVSRDPTKNVMDGYVTGDRHGGGAVFALDLTENLIFAGTRKGHVKIFDQRSSPTKDEANDRGESKPEIHLKLKTSITNVRRIEQGVLVASIDGSIGTYDLRFLRSRPAPVVSFSGHSNSYTTDLGFDVFHDSFFAAAGQDKKIRLWSLRASSPITPSLSAPLSLLAKTFEAPVKALRFRPELNSTPRRDDGFESPREWGRRLRLWVGDGAALMEFGYELD